ncbi:hypothetical protein MRX96_014452 [Rhipicephalus microplus]
MQTATAYRANPFPSSSCTTTLCQLVQQRHSFGAKLDDVGRPIRARCSSLIGVGRVEMAHIPEREEGDDLPPSLLGA